MQDTIRTTDRARYLAQRYSWLAQGLAMRPMLAMGQRTPPAIDPAVVAEVRRRYRALLDRDLDNAATGLYPRELLFEMPRRRTHLPRFLRDLVQVRRRRAAKHWNDLPSDVDASEYPPYFRRNFHWQTDGYLSRRSASLYDFSVELLFLGAADAMRRQAIPPVVRYLREQSEPQRVLDVACGTGRFLRQLAAAAPGHRFAGLDLSAWYLREARANLADVDHISFIEDNAESMPLRDATQDVVTSVFLFHELPPRARSAVLADITRVVRPGGLVVLADSVQLVDTPELEPALLDFPAVFHEPFYEGYIRDDLAARAEAAGLVVDRVETHHVTKVVVAHRPA